MDTEQLIRELKRDAVSIISEEDLIFKLKSGKKLKIKHGADPSRPDLHLGHSVVLKKLRLFQELGHEIIFVIGDFTGMIGDPSGRSKARVPLTFEQTRENAESYIEQVCKILDPEKTKIVFNSDWLAEMKFADILALAGKYTIARIMERDDFADRWSNNHPIGLHELFYPLMQGYDSVALNADIEVGGSDQTFNLLVGRELQKDYGMDPQTVITFPLLPGLDGKEKMSKSSGNYIGINEEPGVMFEKCMKVPDELMDEYFRLTTDIPEEAYIRLVREDQREAHFVYARNIVCAYAGELCAYAAEKRYIDVSKGRIPEITDEYKTKCGEVILTDLLVMCGLAPSKSEAGRLIRGGGIKADGKTLNDCSVCIQGVGEVVIQKGKNHFVKVIFSEVL